MYSIAACVGLVLPDDNAFRDLIEALISAVKLTRSVSGARVYRWQDPSGARLTIVKNGQITVSYSNTTAVRFAAGMYLDNGHFFAEVVDESGEQVAGIAVKPECAADFGARAATQRPIDTVGITAFGVDVTVFSSEEAFQQSSASLLTSASAGADDGESNAMELRYSAESLVPFGTFDRAAPDSSALLNGTVLSAQIVTNVWTGRQFVAARVRTSGLEVDLCMPWNEGEPIPEPGNIIGGSVYLTATLTDSSPFTIVDLGRSELPRSFWQRITRRR